MSGDRDEKLASVLGFCLQQNYAMDHANAAVHCARVKFSPITFRIAELMRDVLADEGVTEEDVVDLYPTLAEVLRHLGAYEEDPGR